MLYIKVSIPIYLYKTFIYSYNKKDNLFVGQGVKVELNKRLLDGYVIEISKKTDLKSKIKPILSRNQHSIKLKKELLSTINWISKYYICPIGKTLKSTIPYQLFSPNIHTKKKYLKITKLGKKKLDKLKYHKQVQILKYLDKKNDYIDIFEIKSITNSYMQICKKLDDKKWIDIKEIDTIENNSSKKNNLEKSTTLNEKQLVIYKDIKNKINKKCNHFILSGVPGSGKTEIYIKLIKDTLRLNKDVIVLVPEISLINQTYQKIEQNFPNQVSSWHSKVSLKDKKNIINDIKKENIKIIVGARSALFTPFNNLGLIIVDEEQESAYKQLNQTPYYNARDVAIMRAKFRGCPVILSSATLSLESFYNIKNNNFHYYYINERYKNHAMPEVTLIDMTREYYKNRNPVISQKMLFEIDSTLQKNEQIILLQNRRSYAYIIKCTTCNYLIKCKNCNITMKYHKTTNEMKCHHCNYFSNFSSQCKVCNNKSIKLIGLGTQKIESILNKLFPSASIIRYDRDVTQNKDNYHKILSDFEKGKYNILIGTQMIAKGLDFKNVSLVGIINADVGMLLPDFRAGEKIFQLIYQLIGRSGRHKKNSKAIIQSYNVKDEYINLACTQKLNDFYEFGLRERESLFYPPFSRLIKISVHGGNKLKVKSKINVIHKKLTPLKCLNILGPAIAPIEKINNRYRMHIIIKSHKKDWILIFNHIINKIGFSTFENKSKSVSVKIDVDPISFL